MNLNLTGLKSSYPRPGYEQINVKTCKLNTYRFFLFEGGGQGGG